jgi:hypothetical protein
MPKGDRQTGTQQPLPFPKASLEPARLDDSPQTTHPADTRLQKQISRIAGSASKKSNFNSNAFVRMSGETDELKPVALPVRFLERRRLLHAPGSQYLDPGEGIFSVGSWIFIILCLAAAIVALLRIRKLSSRPA